MEQLPIPVGTPKPPESPIIVLDDHQKQVILSSIVATAKTLLNIPYDIEPGGDVAWTGRGKWTDLTELPKTLDCSGLVAGVCHKVGLKMPDGSQNQFNFTIAIENARPGDFAFFGRDKDITKIYHVGIVLDQLFIIEARQYNKDAKFDTGKVITRPRANWEKYESFVGYRSHPRLV